MTTINDRSPNFLGYILGACAVIAAALSLCTVIWTASTISSDARDAKAGWAAIQSENLAPRMTAMENQMAEYKADQKLQTAALEDLKLSQQRTEAGVEAITEKMSMFMSNVLPIRPRK